MFGVCDCMFGCLVNVVWFGLWLCSGFCLVVCYLRYACAVGVFNSVVVLLFMFFVCCFILFVLVWWAICLVVVWI